MPDNKVKLIIEAADNSKAAFSALMKSVRELENEGKRTSSSITGFFKAAQANWLAAAAAITGAIYSMKTAWDMIKLGAGLAEQKGILDNLAQKYKTTADAIVASMEQASAGLIAKSDLMQIALSGISKGLNPDQLINLADAARILSDVVGTDATTALRDLSEALETGRSRTLKGYTGATLDLEDAFGKLASKMNAAEKSQAMYALVMIHAKKLQAEQKKDVDDAADSVERLEAKWKNLTDAVAGYAKKVGLVVADWATRGFTGKRLDQVLAPPAAPGGTPDKTDTSTAKYEKIIADLKKALQRKEDAENESKKHSVDLIAAIKEAEKEALEFEALKLYDKEGSQHEKMIAAIAGSGATLTQMELDRRQNEMDELTKSSGYKQAVLQAEHSFALQLINELTEAEIEYANNHMSLFEGMKKGWDDWLKSAANEGVAGFNIVKKAIDGVIDALADFAMTGKMNFKSLADSIIRDLIRIEIQALITSAVSGNKSSGGNSSGWLGSVVSMVGGWFAGGSANGNAFEGGRVIRFARGGIVNRPTLFPMARGAGLMGEAGPEAVMPLKRGADGKLGVAASGGGGTVINNNIYAIDTQSFAEVCKRNPSAVISPMVEALKSNSSLRYVMMDLLGEK